MTTDVIPIADYRAPEEEEDNVPRGIGIAILIEATVIALAYLGWRLGELALAWAAG